MPTETESNFMAIQSGNFYEDLILYDFSKEIRT
jgi:hypothetical protein